MATSILLSNPFSTSPKTLCSISPNLTKPIRILPTKQFLSNPHLSLSNSVHVRRKILVIGGEKTEGSSVSDEAPVVVVGEDSAVFNLAKQKISSWVYFTVVLATVLIILDVAWLDNNTGFGKVFIDSVSSLSESPEVGGVLFSKPELQIWQAGLLSIIFRVWKMIRYSYGQYWAMEKFLAGGLAVMLMLTLIFALVHSGLASLRDAGEKLIGERAFRVLFAGTSLPLAVSTVVYFINHRYDGVQLWQLQDIPWLHHLLWLSNFISFFFLYPSTFNLLEVAAVDKPKMHLWESGIMRITRHPQMVGQVMWCLAHTIWIGNSVAVAASVGLIGHHLFGVWNGDRRLAIRYGENFEVVKSRTSVVPFAAILDGRQKLPKDYYKEFIRLPYLSITALTFGAYLAHPLMRAASYGLHW